MSLFESLYPNDLDASETFTTILDGYNQSSNFSFEHSFGVGAGGGGGSGSGGGGSAATRRLTRLLQKEFSFTWIVFGTIGNLLSLCVLCRRKMRIHSTFTYLTLLAICDTLVLYFGLLRDYLVNKYKVDVDGDLLCKFHVFAFYFVLHMASWLLVAVNVDRLIAASFLSLSKRWCTPRTALTVSMWLALVLAMINVHFLYYVDSAPRPRLPISRIAINLDGPLVSSDLLYSSGANANGAARLNESSLTSSSTTSNFSSLLNTMMSGAGRGASIVDTSNNNSSSSSSTGRSSPPTMSSTASYTFFYYLNNENLIKIGMNDVDPQRNSQKYSEFLSNRQKYVNDLLLSGSLAQFSTLVSPKLSMSDAEASSSSNSSGGDGASGRETEDGDDSKLHEDSITDYAHESPINPYVYQKCYVKANKPTYSYFFQNVFPWIDASAQVMMPFIVMLVCNVNIILKVLLTKNKTNGKNLKRLRKIKGMCIMIVSVSVIFFVLEFPVLIFICLLQGEWIQPDWPYIELVWTIMNMMMYTNHVINFFSYCMTGTKFRRELLRLICVHSMLKFVSNYKSGNYLPTAAAAAAVGGANGGYGGGGGGGGGGTIHNTLLNGIGGTNVHRQHVVLHHHHHRPYMQKNLPLNNLLMAGGVGAAVGVGGTAAALSDMGLGNDAKTSLQLCDSATSSIYNQITAIANGAVTASGNNNINNNNNSSNNNGNESKNAISNASEMDVMSMAQLSHLRLNDNKRGGCGGVEFSLNNSINSSNTGRAAKSKESNGNGNGKRSRRAENRAAFSKHSQLCEINESDASDRFDDDDDEDDDEDDERTSAVHVAVTAAATAAAAPAAPRGQMNLMTLANRIIETTPVFGLALLNNNNNNINNNNNNSNNNNNKNVDTVMATTVANLVSTIPIPNCSTPSPLPKSVVWKSARSESVSVYPAGNECTSGLALNAAGRRSPIKAARSRSLKKKLEEKVKRKPSRDTESAAAGLGLLLVSGGGGGAADAADRVNQSPGSNSLSKFRSFRITTSLQRRVKAKQRETLFITNELQRKSLDDVDIEIDEEDD